jgi:membrane associated rhomboid family serine protease
MLRVTDTYKWNRAKKIMFGISAFITLSFLGGLDTTEGEINVEGTIIGLLISITLFINIYKTSSIKTNKGETR